MARVNTRWAGRLVAALALVAAVLAVVGPASAGTARSDISVFFVRGEQLEPVSRAGTTALAAVQQLIAGPTRAEVGLDFRSYLPAGTRVFSVSVAHGIATVDLNERFASGSDQESLLARLSQLVRTLTGPQGATKVQLVIDGQVAIARFHGISTSGPITFRYLQTPNIAIPKPPAEKLQPPDPAVKVIQQRLIDDNQVVRTIAVSSGKASAPTPPGNYGVYAKIPRWWSTPFREWLPWALPFVGGIAFHQYQDVPPYPTSHGCVRQSFAVAQWTYNFATFGMPVKVIAKS